MFFCFRQSLSIYSHQVLEISKYFCPLQSSEHKIPKQEIGGGNSIELKKGFYKNEPIDELDVQGMYPTIAIEHNISFETVNCRCCKDNPNARIPTEVMDESIHDYEIRNYLVERRVTGYAS